MAAKVTSARFVGRERELARLAVALEHAESGRSTTLLIAGTGGAGASRLLDETGQRLAALPHSFTVVRGIPTAAERATPYAPIVAGLTPILATLGDDTLTAVFGPASAELGRIFPVLRPRLVRLGLDLGPPPPISSERWQPRMLERFLGVFWALGERRPVLLVVEDLHRVDAASRALVTFISRISRPGRLAVVGTYQPDEMTRAHPLHADLAAMSESRRAAARIDLGLFERQEIAELIEAIDGDRPSASLLLLVAERSRGNPLAIEEVLIARREEGGTLQAGGFEESVLARVRRRSPECRRVLRLLSVADGPLTRAELAAVADASEAGTERRPPRSSSTPRRAEAGLDADLTIGLAEAFEHGWVVAGTAADGSDTVAFRHELIGRAVATDLLPLQHRRHLAAVATALADRPAAAAGYWLRAHDVARSRRAAIEALKGMETADAARDTLDLLEEAIELADPTAGARSATAADPPPTRTARAADDSSLAALQARAAEAAFAAGMPLRAAAYAEASAARLDERRDRTRLGLLFERLGRYRRAAGDPPGALAAHQRAVDLVPREPSRERAFVLAALAQVQMLDGMFSEAERSGQEALRIARIVGPEASDIEANALTTLGVSRGWGEDPTAAVELLHEAGRLAAERGDIGERFRAIANLTTVLDLIGRKREAIDIAYDGIVEARRTGLETVFGNFLRGNAAESLFQLGRWAECRELSMTALEWSLSGADFVNAIVNLAIVEIEAGSGEAAGRLLGQLLVEVEAVPDAQSAVPVFAAEASYALWRSDLGDAKRACIRAWDAARRTEDWVLAAKTAAVCLEVDAAIVADARERRDLPALAEARERSRSVLGEAEAAVATSGVKETVGSRKVADAALAAARAFRSRLDGRDDPAHWKEVAAAWDRLADPYQAARARWRQAEAILAVTPDARAGRSKARGPLLDAYEAAGRLGAEPLRRELGELAARALIRLPDEPPRPGPDADVVPVPVGPGLAAGSEHDGLVDGDGLGGSIRPDSDLLRGFVGQPAPKRADPFGLSPREREVLILIAQGRTNREIGERLFISQKTVGVHVGNILAKLDVSGRVEAAAVAIRLGLTDKR